MKTKTCIEKIKTKLETVIVLAITVPLLIYVGVNGVRSKVTQYGVAMYTIGRDEGASLLYKQMNSDLIRQLGIHYNPEKRHFEKWVQPKSTNTVEAK